MRSSLLLLLALGCCVAIVLGYCGPEGCQRESVELRESESVQRNVRSTSSQCGRHGDPCASDSECCPNIQCHRYAKMCQVKITAEELQAQRDIILGRGKRP